ncbi:MAG TPA: nuclear transport factor 2 family protein [Thermoleophilaceae bacterium]|nr:nuclear transport factor 2 family protein [Thermoleophilaceae bacterium]
MHPFRAAVEARDLDAAIALFADDATLDSPVAFKPFAGIDQVRVVLGAVIEVFEVFEDFEYTDELGGEGGVHALVFSARVGDKAVQGLDLIRADADGRITNLTVMIRPLSGLIALAEAMAPKVSHLAK